jgi:hypothetical protein
MPSPTVGEPADSQSRPAPSSWQQLTRTGTATVVATNALVAAVSGLLSIWSGDSRRPALIGISIAAGLIFFANLFYARIRASHKREIDALVTRHQEELSVLRRTVAAASANRPKRESAYSRRNHQLEHDLHSLRETLQEVLVRTTAYRDDVELTYFIGASEAQDVVIERRRTTPAVEAPLSLFTTRLTMPVEPETPLLRLDDVELVARSEDDHISVRAFALTEQTGLLRCLFAFFPAITGPTGWSVRYRVPLWSRLRTTGSDKLTWSPLARHDDPEKSTIISLTVKFVFPRGTRADVAVRDDSGARLPFSEGEGPPTFTWTRSHPDPRVYRWDLEWRGATR